MLLVSTSAFQRCCTRHHVQKEQKHMTSKKQRKRELSSVDASPPGAAATPSNNLRGANFPLCTRADDTRNVLQHCEGCRANSQDTEFALVIAIVMWSRRQSTYTQYVSSHSHTRHRPSIVITSGRHRSGPEWANLAQTGSWPGFV